MKLTIEDKIKLVSGKSAWRTNDCNGKLPSIMLSDGPHGLRVPYEDMVVQNNNSHYATAFPTASAAACSWDIEAVAEEARAIAQEAHAEKVSVVLGPGVNIKRSPLCGRNFEYYSEDPYLAGTLATSFVNSMQEEGIGTSLKHYAVNSQETFRMTSNSQVDERALREIYTKAFEMTVKNAHPTTVMASYNRVNGVYGCRNKHLLTELLRDEWGFKGVVVSDWGACNNLPDAINAGMDLEMPGNNGIHFVELRHDMVKGDLTNLALTKAATRVADLAINQSKNIKDSMADRDYSNKVALNLCNESAVLLENDGLLPLPYGTKVVVIGDLAVNTRFQGGGSSHINTRELVNGVDALKAYGLDVKFARGYDASKLRPDKNLEQEALSLIKPHSIVLFYGGLTDKVEGEGFDRSSLDIPYNQIHLLKQILMCTNDVAFIAFGGAPMNFSFRNYVSSILLMHLGGQAVQESAAMLITGVKTPSGKLAETYPLKLKDVPCYNYFGKMNLDIQYRESIFVGYRYYQTYGRRVMYPFGYGLSYTEFEYSELELANEYIGGKMQVKVKITNIGDFPGREVVQLYVGNPKCKYLRAAKELRAFAKTKLLEPEESEVITLTLDETSFNLFDADTNRYVVPSGTYDIQIGASVEDIRISKMIDVTGEDYNPDRRKELAEYFSQTGDRFTITKTQFAKLYNMPFSTFSFMTKGEFTTENSLNQLAEHSLLGRTVRGVAKLGIRAMYLGRSKEDPELKMMLSLAIDGTIDSAACQSNGILPYRLAEAVVHAANGEKVKAVRKLIKGNKLKERIEKLELRRMFKDKEL